MSFLLSVGLSGSLLTEGMPAQAAGTAANTVISSTASATYNDPDNTGTTLDALSNTVTVTVAEVAGITVGAGPITDTTAGHAGNILPGDVVTFDFIVTNIGNASNTIALPGAATVIGSGTAGMLQYSLDGTSFITIPTGGLTATASVAPGGTVLVRVPVTVSASARTGDALKVLLGNTGANDNSTDTQNAAYPDSSINNDVHTVSGTAQNGLREASFSQNETVGSQAQALALILLTRTGFVQSTTPAASTLTYGLALKVSSTLPTGPNASHALAAADLAPTIIHLNGSAVPQILIANAVPIGTTLTSLAPPPSGWSAVYTTTATTTAAGDALWTTTAPGDLATVTRLGFVTVGTLAKGTSLSGFSYLVTTTGASRTAPTQVNNIAQVFGQTAGDTAHAPVFDESGDQNPSGFNADGSRGPNTVRLGVANPAADGIDSGNDNTGTGTAPGGRDNTCTVSSSTIVLNGPSGPPDAPKPTGPISTDDSFTNQSVPVAPGTDAGTTISPPVITFTNTLSNPGVAPLGSNLLLLPVPSGTPGDLPPDTTLMLTCRSITADYRYDGTRWNLTSGAPISLPSLAANSSVSYTAAVHLPAATPLSTDSGSGFPIIILADVDLNGDGLPQKEEPSSRTIDRVYTGFLRVTQLARIVAADGKTVLQDYGTGPVSVNIHSGYFIDYQITYTNISTASGVGANNVQLNAVGVSLVEDGAAGTNNWALTGPNGLLLTSNVIGSAIDSGGGTVTFYNGNPPVEGTDKSGITPAADVTKYVVTAAGSLAPGMSRTFTFRRKIN